MRQKMQINYGKADIRIHDNGYASITAPRGVVRIWIGEPDEVRDAMEDADGHASEVRSVLIAPIVAELQSIVTGSASVAAGGELERVDTVTLSRAEIEQAKSQSALYQDLVALGMSDRDIAELFGFAG